MLTVFNLQIDIFQSVIFRTRILKRNIFELNLKSARQVKHSFAVGHLVFGIYNLKIIIDKRNYLGGFAESCSHFHYAADYLHKSTAVKHERTDTEKTVQTLNADKKINAKTDKRTQNRNKRTLLRRVHWGFFQNPFAVCQESVRCGVLD